jgi:ABC-2 type transport system ATP-binding protein
VIQTRSLTKRYGETTAVDDLSFTVEPGRVTGFLGPNGSGKSTTMRMILGLDRPTAGVALVNGRPYRELKDPLRTIGALLDAKWVHPNRSARAHLRWLAATNRIPTTRIDAVLDQVGLTAVADRRAGAFSLGMAQRLGIAAALLGDPEILLFDEPVNGLDPEGIVWIRQFMKRLAGEGRTILVSSHLLPEMALTASDLVVIGRGRLITAASTADFVESASHSTVRVGTLQTDELTSALRHAGVRVEPDAENAFSLIVTGTDIARVGVLAAAAGVVLTELSVQRASLEEAFMHITGHDIEYAAGSPADGADLSPALAGAGR